MGGIGLTLNKKGNSLRFIGRYKGRDYKIGAWQKYESEFLIFY